MRSPTPARCSVQIGRARSINDMLQALPADSQLPAAVALVRDPQTTNLGVRSSNLFGRANKSL